MKQLSIVIATYNRAEGLPSLVAALFAQDFPSAGLEISIVNDGSSDGTATVLEQIERERATSHPGVFRFFTQKNSGQAKARDLGVSQATGKILLFLDDDMEPCHPSFLRAHCACHEQDGGQLRVVLGAIEPPKGNPPRPAFEHMYESYMAADRAGFLAGTKQPGGWNLFAANFSINKSLYLAVGGFNHKFYHAEDVELGHRLSQHPGVTFCYCKDGNAYHNSKTGRYRNFIQRARSYGRLDYQMYRFFQQDRELCPFRNFPRPGLFGRVLTRMVTGSGLAVAVATSVLVALARLTNREASRSLAIALCKLIYKMQYMRSLYLTMDRKAFWLELDQYQATPRP